MPRFESFFYHSMMVGPSEIILCLSFFICPSVNGDDKNKVSKQGMVMQEAEVQGHLRLHSKFKANLSHMRQYLKININPHVHRPFGDGESEHFSIILSIISNC